jgi:hypothetical protein
VDFLSANLVGATLLLALFLPGMTPRSLSQAVSPR